MPKCVQCLKAKSCKFFVQRSNPGTHSTREFHYSYSNLAAVYVKKGQTIEAKEVIGKVFTHPSSGKSELKFSVFQTPRLSIKGMGLQDGVAFHQIRLFLDYT